MISYLKKQKRQVIVIFIALLLLAFFLCFKAEQNPADISLPLQSEKTSLENKEEQAASYYGEFESSDENGGVPANPTNKTDPKNETPVVNTRKDLPKLLEIPKLGVSANIQSVGLNSKNEMDVPSNDWDVAWYNLGSKPGNIGSAVIAGHLDNRFGKPAVFWNLDKLEIGDDVFVTDGNNNKKHFQVISSEKYETGTAPLEKIFGANDGAYLNLITCGGVWDRTKNNYSERFVVFTKYVL